MASLAGIASVKGGEIYASVKEKSIELGEVRSSVGDGAKQPK